MKLAVLLGSLIIGLLVTGLPAYNAGFTPASIGEWLFNALFVAAILGFLGMKFLLNDHTRSPFSARNGKKKK